MIRTRHSALRLPLVAALLAVVLRVLIPAGFMISPSGADAGLVRIELCSQAGMRTAWLAPDGSIVDRADPGGHEDDPGTTTDHAACAFASPAHTPPPPVPVTLAAPPLAVAGLAPAMPVADLVPGRGLAAPPPPATAPPALI